MIYFNSNIEHLRIKRKLDVKDFVDVLGKSYSSTHSYFSGKTEPNFKVMEAFAKFFNVSIGDLMGNDLSKNEKIASYASKLQEEKGVYLKVSKMVPIVPPSSKSGFINSLIGSQTHEEFEYSPVSRFMGRVDLFYRSSGGDMKEKYPSGAFLPARILSDDDFLQPGKDYLFDTKNGLILKTLKSASEKGDLTLASTNTEYSDITINEKEITGKAIITGSYEDK